MSQVEKDIWSRSAIEIKPGPSKLLHNGRTYILLHHWASVVRSEWWRVTNWAVFHVVRKLLNHRFLPFQPADNCHMKWKLSHNWSKCRIAIIQIGETSLFLAIILSLWPDCLGAVPIFLPAPLMWLALPEIGVNRSCADEALPIMYLHHLNLTN